MSELVLHESSNPDSSSSDDELNLIKKETCNYNFTKMIKSKDKVDKRLLDQYLIKQAHRSGVQLDFRDNCFEGDEQKLNVVQQISSYQNSE